MANTLHGCAAMQRDLDRIESWTRKNIMMFSKGKCEVPHLRRNDTLQQYMLGSGHLESSFDWKNLGVLVEKEVTEPRVHPCDKGQWHPELHQEECCQQAMGSDPDPSLLLGTGGDLTWRAVSSSGSPVQGRFGLTGAVQ